MTKPRFSLEVFPPREPTQDFWDAVAFFIRTHPSFISVTCSAGGSGIDTTGDIASEIITRYNFPHVAAHMVCVGRTADQMQTLAADYHGIGIQHIVALRGDCVNDSKQGLQHASELVHLLRKKTQPQWEISVAGYPEGHPDSPDKQTDLDYLQRKADEGVDRILTQFFFDPDVFLRYRDAVAKRGIAAPVVPGILPIMQFERAAAFAQKCQARMPVFVRKMLGGLEDDKDGHDRLAFAFLISQIETLHREGVNDFHFYTLNQSRLFELLIRWVNAYL